jgi:hypothetical protein
LSSARPRVGRFPARRLLQLDMELARPHPECTIHQEGAYIRADVAHGSAQEIQECYRTVASLALEHKFERVLVVGVGQDDSHSHLTARDVVIALDVIGVPAGFKLAFVGKSDATLNGYKHAEIAAKERGLRVRVFRDEQAAIAWLTAPDIH